ncbi:MAG: rod shape-determining protein MreD [Pseudomonadota bacterium]
MPVTPSVLTKPSSAKFIALTLLVALILNFLPWEEMLPLRPDFVALLLLYWSIHYPRKLGLGVAWLMGLLVDVADGSLLGQHALAYSVMIFLALLLHRRIQQFGPWQQALHVAVLLLLSQALALLVRLVAGDDFTGWGYFLPTLTGMAAWPALLLLVQSAQQRKSKPEDAYPTGPK